MANRRIGSTMFWEAFWKQIYGERRQDQGCQGDCSQGRRPCTCRTIKPEKDITVDQSIKAKPIFVFGSNEAGHHGMGAAKFAMQNHGAVYGIGYGLRGSSFAIPTKDQNIRTLPLTKIKGYVDAFRVFAAAHPELTFQITPIGCGLAGYKPANIAPMFDGCTPNCILPAEFGGPGEPWKG